MPILFDDLLSHVSPNELLSNFLTRKLAHLNDYDSYISRNDARVFAFRQSEWLSDTSPGSTCSGKDHETFPSLWICGFFVRSTSSPCDLPLVDIHDTAIEARFR